MPGPNPNAGLAITAGAAPPPGFDPVNNRQDRLLLPTFGLPPHPTDDPRTIALEHWEALFAPGFQIVSPLPRPAVPIAPGVVALTAPPPAGPGNSGPPGASGLSQTSPNWSGGLIEARPDSRIFSVAGRWKVPAVSPGTPYPGGPLPHRCSIWTGIDGNTKWNDSMPQVGTEHTVSGDPSANTHAFWVQWWYGHGLTVPIYIDGVAIAEGDEVLCGIVLDAARGTAAFHVKNQRTGRLAAMTAANQARPAAGATAEWIVERPGDTPNSWDKPFIDPDKAFHPLPRFEPIGPLAFSVNGRTVAQKDMTLISMRERRVDPSRSAVIASAVRDAGGNLLVVYQGP